MILHPLTPDINSHAPAIKKLDAKLLPKKLSPEQIAATEALWKNQFKVPVNAPVDEAYATVKVGNKIVATLYNSGAAVTSNLDQGKLRKLPSMGESETLVGPALAQKRAAEIAKALGGTIEKASTAQSATQWKPPQIEWTYDFQAMQEAQTLRDARSAQNAYAHAARGAFRW